MRIDDRLDENRSRRRERLFDNRATVFRSFDRKPGRTAGARHHREIDRLQIADVFRVAEKDHLLPFDLAQGVVLDDDDLDRELVFDRGGELAHQHRQPAVADKGNDLAVGIGGLRADRIRQAARHRREIARQREHLLTADRDVAGHPGRDRAGIGRDDRVVAQPLAKLMRHDLRLHRHILPAGALQHQLFPFGLALLRLFEPGAVGISVEVRDQTAQYTQ